MQSCKKENKILFHSPTNSKLRSRFICSIIVILRLYVQKNFGQIRWGRSESSQYFNSCIKLSIDGATSESGNSYCSSGPSVSGDIRSCSEFAEVTGGSSRFAEVTRGSSEFRSGLDDVDRVGSEMWSSFDEVTGPGSGFWPRAFAVNRMDSDFVSKFAEFTRSRLEFRSREFEVNWSCSKFRPCFLELMPRDSKFKPSLVEVSRFRSLLVVIIRSCLEFRPIFAEISRSLSEIVWVCFMTWWCDGYEHREYWGGGRRGKGGVRMEHSWW